jgi:hypothetical protein
MVTILVAAAMAGDQKKRSKDDPDSIGDRDVGGGLNFYSLEREIGLGKQMAAEVAAGAEFRSIPSIAGRPYSAMQKES